MVRYGPAVLDAGAWIDASLDRPCPVCDGIEGCGAMRDEGFVRCAEQPSEWPLIVGGWLHRVEVQSRERVSV